MFKSFLALAILLSVQTPQSVTQPPRVAETGTIAGTVAPPAQQALSQPIQVILLSEQYASLWNADVQKRLDVYWERYKPAFAKQKEFFLEVSRVAHKEAANYIVARMRRDFSNNISNYVQETSDEGKFEFKNLPFGEYEILALGKAGNLDLIWQESVDVTSPVPQFLALKNRLP